MRFTVRRGFRLGRIARSRALWASCAFYGRMLKKIMNDFDIIKRARLLVPSYQTGCRRLGSEVSAFIAGSSAASLYISGFLPVLKERRCLASCI